MWEQVYYNNSLKEWGISLLIIIGAFLVNKLIFVFYKRVIQRITSKSSSRFDDNFFVSMENPIYMGVLLLAFWVAANRLQLDKEVFEAIKKSYDALVVLNFTWLIARLAGASIAKEVVEDTGRKKRKRFRVDAKLYPIVKRTVLIVIWVFGIITALYNVGIKVTTLLGTLGIGGIAFALAAQDTIKNIFGGFTIFADKTYRIGDTIKFDSVEGTVMDIGLRSTRILNYDKRLLTIPNYQLMDSVITNISSESGRRIVMELGLTYSTSLDKMQEAMQILRDMPNRIPEIRNKDVVVSFTDFGDSALIITFIYFILKSSDIYETRSKVNIEILRAFNEAGLDLAFPTQTLYIEKGDVN
ncbi:MAG: mechanosensitive ion channel family protein [Tannerella sp.]|jgi:MscS family membrane protein|nr:mechanosensitive ion channel family protein [Tannerella sp.]